MGRPQRRAAIPPDATALDPEVWSPHYLPAWSSRAATAATYRLADSCPHLSIPPQQGLWMPDQQVPPEFSTSLRVSGIQSGNFSGPVGSTIGQQPIRPGAVVTEFQPELWGWTPTYGYLEMRARMVLTPSSMAAWWLVGLETEPTRCAEICVAEIFGDSVVRGTSAVGMGLHSFRDPHIAEDFSAPVLAIDPAGFHTYAVDWREDSVEFYVDGRAVRRCAKPPRYPMQSMLAVFDFPGRGGSASSGHGAVTPELIVDFLRGYR